MTMINFDNNTVLTITLLILAVYFGLRIICGVGSALFYALLLWLISDD